MLAIALVAAVGVPTAIGLSVIPGLLAGAAIVYAIRHTPRPTNRDRLPLRIRVRPVQRGDLGRLMGAVAAFEAGNVAATLLILRATELLTPDRGRQSATTIALVLYLGYNLAATVASVPAGRIADRAGRRGPFTVLTAGVAAFAIAYTCSPSPAPALSCWQSRSSWPESVSAPSRPPNTPPSPQWHPTTCAAPRSGCSPRSSRWETSPPLASPASFGP